MSESPRARIKRTNKEAKNDVRERDERHNEFLRAGRQQLLGAVALLDGSSIPSLNIEVLKPATVLDRLIRDGTFTIAEYVTGKKNHHSTNTRLYLADSRQGWHIPSQAVEPDAYLEDIKPVAIPTFAITTDATIWLNTRVAYGAHSDTLGVLENSNPIPGETIGYYAKAIEQFIDSSEHGSH